MDSILALRPFVPARDFELSKRFYQALDFELALEDDGIAIFELERFGFILQRFYHPDLAGNFMMQLLVRDLDAWWRRVDAADLPAQFEVKPPRAPAMQSWGLRVGFLVDPSGVLWHIAEARV